MVSIGFDGSLTCRDSMLEVIAGAGLKGGGSQGSVEVQTNHRDNFNVKNKIGRHLVDGC